MADILDELEGILSKDEVAKLRTSPLAQRLQRGDAVREYYDGNMDGDPPPPVRQQQDPPPRREPGGESLADVLGQLRTVTDGLSKIPQTVQDEVKKVVDAEGNKLFANVLSASMRNNRELSKVDARHRADFGEDLDDDKLNAHAEAARAAGRPFRSVTEAYEDMTREARQEKIVSARVETGVREGLKQRTTASLPGVSGNSGSPMLRALKAVPAGGTNGSAVSSAARALEDRLAERGEQVA